MLQRRFGVLIAVMVIVSSLLIALPALADSNVRIVRLSHINGDAQINNNSKDQGFTHAVLNMPVTSGMWLYTPSGGRAEVEFENGSTVRVVDEAQIQFEKLALAKSGGKIDLIDIDHGVVYFNFNKVSKNDQIRISVGGRTFRVSKAAHLRVTADDKIISMAVMHGQAKLEGVDTFDTEVKENQTLYLDASDTMRFKVAKGTDTIGSDTWDKKRDDDVVALNAHTNNLGMVNAYDAQYSSLGAYGNFFMLPGYGNVWQPFGMASGWDPYSSGLWGFYPGMGYMWISSYPWGWAPYRYGQWNYLPSNGWFWVPGTNFSAFNYGPSFGVVPMGWRAPAAPVANASVRPAQMVVVGNPPNVHPAVLSGHAQLNTHPAPVVRTQPLGMGAAAARASQGGQRGIPSAASRSTSPGQGTQRSSGPATHSMGSGPSFGGGAAASSHSTMVGGSGGRPK
jgi:hypothetical protein